MVTAFVTNYVQITEHYSIPMPITKMFLPVVVAVRKVIIPQYQNAANAAQILPLTGSIVFIVIQKTQI